MPEEKWVCTACPGWGTDSAGNQYGFNVSYSDDDGNTWSEYQHFYSRFSDGDANDCIVAMASLVQLKDENGKAYAYRDAAGNYYELNFGLSF